MKIQAACCAILLSGTLFAADAVNEVKNAAKKLAEKENYSWRTTVDMGTSGGNGGGGRFRVGPTEGKTEKGGTTFLTMSRGDNTIDAVLKGEKGALKTDEGWKSLSEVTRDDGGRQNAGRFMGRMLQNYRLPAAEAEDLAGKTKDLKKTGESYSGDLTEEGVKQLFMRGRRRGADNPGPSNAKGTAKFWVKDGILSKYEYHVEGTVEFNGNERDVKRTTTVEIKDVGTTKISVPEDAAKKLS